MATIVVYYSMNGHVKKAAEDYAAKNGFETLELKEPKPRTGTSGFVKSGFQATFKIGSKIVKPERDFSLYEKVIVCSPIWAGKLSAPVRTFLRKYGKSCKALEYVIMHADKEKTFSEVFDDMDAVAGKKRVAAKSLVQGESMQ
jgi:flavodoxin